MRSSNIVSTLLQTAALSLIVAAHAAAQPLRIVSVGDPVLSDLRLLSREAGKSLLSLTPPLSSDEVRNLLASIDIGSLSPAGTDSYNRVVDHLRAPSVLADGALGFAVKPVLALEGRVRSNPEAAWVRSESDTASPIKFPLEFYFGDSLYATGDLEIRADPTYYDEGGEHWGTNIPAATDRFDLNIPLRSYVSAGGKWWNAQLGRNALSFGAAFTGNLAVSDGPDYHDYARLSLFSPNFKYSMLVSHLPLSTEGLGDTYEARYPSAFTETTQRYLYYHRWDVRLYERFSFSVGEGALVGNSPLELRFLNPFSIYHGLFSWLDYPQTSGDLVGSLLSFEFDYAPMPRLALYGQFVMNEFQTDYERDKWPEDGRPNGLGYLAGASWIRFFGGVRADFSAEAVYADPYLYELSSPFSSYVWMRRLSALSGKDPRYAWIGHPEGRDFALFALRAELSGNLPEKRGRLGSRLELSYKLQGEHGIEWDWAEGADSSGETAPTGTPERRLTASSSTYWMPSSRLTLAFHLAGVRVDDADHVSGKTDFGAEAAVSAKFSL